MRVYLYIILVLLLPNYVLADTVNEKSGSNHSTAIIPFHSVGIVSASQSVVSSSVNPVYGQRVLWVCPIPSDKKKEGVSCVVCFYYGGSQKGIEEKYFEISEILEKSHGPELIKQLWVIRLKGSDDKYALILEPLNSKRQDVINIARDMAMIIKQSKHKKSKVRLDKLATPLCSDVVNSEIRYQPRSPSKKTQKNGNLANLLDQLDNAKSYLQTLVRDTDADHNAVIIATYDRENDRLIPIEFPKDANAFKDKKTNIVIVKESGSGAGTMYYVGYSPNAEDAFDSKYSIPAIAFPLNMPGLSIKDGVQHVVNTPFNKDLDTDEMVQYGFHYIKEKVNEAFIEISSLDVPSLFATGLPVHMALPDQTNLVIMTILLIEHMDYANYLPFLAYQKKKRHRILLGIKKSSEKKLHKLMLSQMRKVLVNLAANEEQSYHYAMSRSGAYGLAQIIKPSYQSLLKLYPKAELIPDFFAGMRHHSNAVMAQFLHLDSELSTLSKAKPLQTIVSSNQINQKSELIFDLMIAGYNFSAPRLKNLINKKGYQVSKWQKHLPWETQLYIFKAHFVRDHLKKMMIKSSN